MTDTTDVSDVWELSYEENPIPSVFFIGRPAKEQLVNHSKFVEELTVTPAMADELLKYGIAYNHVGRRCAVLETVYAEIGLQNS